MESPKTLKFELGEADTREFRKWAAEHAPVCSLRGKYTGAIGGGYTFTFTDTAIGQLTSVACACGESKHLSNDI